MNQKVKKKQVWRRGKGTKRKHGKKRKKKTQENRREERRKGIEEFIKGRRGENQGRSANVQGEIQ